MGAVTPGEGRDEARGDRPGGDEATLRTFFAPDGRLRSMPARRGARLLVLDRLAQRFEPGVRYPEPEVNGLLRPAHDDVAMLRRYLVDEGFLARERGVYWRVGGSVDGV